MTTLFLITLLQTDPYSGMSSGETAAVAGLGVGMVLFFFAFLFFFLFCMYKIFKKAGREDAWGAFIPIYSSFIQIDIIKRPWWEFFMYWIPFYGFYLMIVDLNRLSKFFGKSEGFTVGLFFLSFIFLPILAFDDSKYNPDALPDLRDK